ncbi:MAG TPA: DUF1850 domain-containing protein [Chloroflexota bacterium]|nr:DUF1850 domain-containing protein [Chloroflexota bacterium]
MAAAAVWLLRPLPTLRLVNDTRQRELTCAAVREGSTLGLSYVHSIYQQPATEEFRVSASGLILVRLRSPSVPVLEYYARPEPIETDGNEFVIEVMPQRHTALSVLVSALGQRTVLYDGHTWPLYRLAGDGDRVRLAVETVPRMCTLWTRRR